MARAIACAIALGCGGAEIEGVDASANDAGVDGSFCVFCDASYDYSPPPPPPPPIIDAGVMDGSLVWCGHGPDGGDVMCVGPQEYCCVHTTPLGDGGFAFAFACTPSSAPVQCSASLYCDDPGDCEGGVCCWDFASINRSTCTTGSLCQCSPYPNCYFRRMCEPDAGAPDGSACICKASVIPEYGTCL